MARLNGPLVGKPRVLTIRPCAAGDLGRILEVENESFSYPYDMSTFRYYLKSERDRILVAEEKGAVIGYAIVSTNGESGQIVSIAVIPRSRGQGVGSSLMRESLRFLEGRTRRVELQVGVTNRGAEKFYRRFGFRESGKLRHYYPSGEDAVLMVREAHD